MPWALMAPPPASVTRQVHASLVEPETVHVNASEPFGGNETLAGLTVTVTAMPTTFPDSLGLEPDSLGLEPDPATAVDVGAREAQAALASAIAAKPTCLAVRLICRLLASRIIGSVSQAGHVCTQTELSEDVHADG